MTEHADIKVIRLRNFKELLLRFRDMPSQRDLPANGLFKRFAEFVDITPAYISHIVNRHKDIGESIARKLESAFGLEYGWMDHDRVVSAHASPQERRAVQTFVDLYRADSEGLMQAIVRYAAEIAHPHLGRNNNAGGRAVLAREIITRDRVPSKVATKKRVPARSDLTTMSV